MVSCRTFAWIAACLAACSSAATPPDTATGSPDADVPDIAADSTGFDLAAADAPADATADADPVDVVDAAQDVDAGQEVDALDIPDATADSVPDVPPPPPTLTSVSWVAMPAAATPGDMATAYSTAQVQVAWSDGKTATSALAWHLLTRAGDVLAGQVVGGLQDGKGAPILDKSLGAPGTQAYSDCPDGTTVHAAGPASLRMVSHFEYLSHDLAGAGTYGAFPMTMGLTTLTQEPGSGLLTATAYAPIDMKPLGLWMPCAASMSPWQTHLGSEEYEPDARCVQDGTCAAQDKLGLGALAIWFGQAGVANPYDYGLLPEVKLAPDGSTQVVKHRALGRLSREQIDVMPDQRTAYMGDDGAYSAMLMFIADQAGDLSAGTLYAAKWQQTDGQGAGQATLQWIRLGHGDDATLAGLAKAAKFADVLQVSPGPAPGFQRVHTTAGEEWLQVQPGQETAAAFLETRRYAALRGATTEFHKMEGVAHDAQTHALFVAMSFVQGGMLAEPGAAADHIHLQQQSAGAVYRCKLAGGQKDSDGQPIPSEWVAVDMAAYVTGVMLGQPDALGNTADPEHIANPDNLKVAPAWRTLFIGEDTGLHVNNALWAVHLDTGKVTRLASVPAGAEVTGLFPFAMGGFGYLTVHFQHPGGASASPVVQGLIQQQWGGGLKAGLGYLGGLPGVGP
jgi:secreted PhoX family phosphatase